MSDLPSNPDHFILMHIKSVSLKHKGSAYKLQLSMADWIRVYLHSFSTLLPTLHKNDKKEIKKKNQNSI